MEDVTPAGAWRTSPGRREAPAPPLSWTRREVFRGVYSLLMFATVLPFCSFCLRTLLAPAFSLGKAPAGTVNLLRACAWPSRLPSRPPQPPQPHRKDGPAPASALYPAHVMLASAVWHAPDSLPERGGPGICPAS